MHRVLVSSWILPGNRVSARKLTPSEAMEAGAIGIVPNTTSVREEADAKTRATGVLCRDTATKFTGCIANNDPAPTGIVVL